MLKLAIILTVAAVVPGFFVIIWLGSSYQQLRISRNRCNELLAELTERPTTSPDAYDRAVREYNQARHRFPGNLIAVLLGFKARDTTTSQRS